MRYKTKELVSLNTSGFIKQKGFTIVELIIAIVILSFAIIGIYSFFHPAILLVSNFYFRSTADYLAQEGLEVVKNIRDNNILRGESWSQGFSSCVAGCQLDYKTGTPPIGGSVNPLEPYNDNNFLNINADGFYSYDAGTPTKFKRKVTITKPFPSNQDILKVVVLVKWDHNGNLFTFDTIGYIYNLY